MYAENDKLVEIRDKKIQFYTSFNPIFAVRGGV